MANEIWAALIGVGGTLAGVWYGAKLSRQAARDLLYEQARSEFASAFTDTLVKLGRGVSNPGVGEAIDILTADFPRHYAAYVRLRTLLPAQKQKEVDLAWAQYTKDDEYELREEAETYRFVHVLGPKSEEHQFMLAQKHVHALLSKTAANMAFNLAPFGRWTLRDKAAQRRCPPR